MSIADRLDSESRRITKIIDDDMIYAKAGDSLIKLGKLIDAAMEHISKLEDINLKLAVKLEGTRIKKASGRTCF